MATKCTNASSDLLLYGLGELPYWRSWSLTLHLKRCPACRERHRQLQRVSSGLADALQPARGGPRMPKAPVAVMQGWLTIFAIILILATGTLSVHLIRSVMLNAYAAGRALPCRPDLPNDTCR